MRAEAVLGVELGARGRSVVRELASQAPLTLVPRRAATTAADGTAVVHLVGSATSPVGGDVVDLRVRVGPGARLLLRGTAATVALPGHDGAVSSAAVHLDVAAGASVDYLPEPTVVSSRADHRAAMSVRLAPDARLRCREVLVLGRSGERPGRLVTATDVVRDGVPLLRQRLDIGDPLLDASAGYLAGARVLATEVLVGADDPAAPASGDWWSLAPLAAGGALATAVGPDAVIAGRRLAEAVAHHPDVGFAAPARW
ncbi:urease accessory protein UreD [Saccharopolyspora cebuensis]|uniref:Urease accessory protein UreD n=1 Tax=Saccharopolyspora cebuensis TaxID=418759 RepID=A0ABV4CH56_9PSEU